MSHNEYRQLRAELLADARFSRRLARQAHYSLNTYAPYYFAVRALADLRCMARR